GQSGDSAGWTPMSPRDEIRPEFRRVPHPQNDAESRFIIECDERAGLDGWWARRFPIEGGKHYRFVALRRVENIENPRRSCPVRITWLDGQGQRVQDDRPVVARYNDGAPPRAEVEHPSDRASENGWTEVSEIYQAPKNAAQALVELHLMWAPRGRV